MRRWTTNIAVRRHIRRLLAAGHTHVTIAARTGLRPTTVTWLAQRRPLAVRVDIAAAILTLRPQLWHDKVPATGAARRLNALVLDGWSLRTIARMLEHLCRHPVDPATLDRIARYRYACIRPQLAEAIAQLYLRADGEYGSTRPSRAVLTDPLRCHSRAAWTPETIDDPLGVANSAKSPSVLRCDLSHTRAA